MNAFSTPSDAELSAELDALRAAPSAIRRSLGKPLSLAQEISWIKQCEKAMECNGDAVATMNRALDAAIVALGGSATSDEIRAGLLAVRHYHLPSLLDAFEVDTRRAY